MDVNGETARELARVLEEFSNALRARDLMRTLGVFANDPAASIYPGGEQLIVGSENIRSFFAYLFAQPITISLRCRLRHVVRVGDIAWVAADGWESIIVDGGGEAQRVPYRLTGVLIQRAGRWQWMQFHGSQPST